MPRALCSGIRREASSEATHWAQLPMPAAPCVKATTPPFLSPACRTEQSPSEFGQVASSNSN
eukprot:scaffold139655_cov130-Phaeocystis_antarctica.AAC.1